MKMSTTLIRFFVKVAILAVAYAAAGFFSEDGQDPFEIVTLDETMECIV